MPVSAQEGIGRSFGDTRRPRPWRSLDGTERHQFDLGEAVFNTRWVPALDPAGRRDGLGPVFNAASCDACHNDGRRGRTPGPDGAVPSDLVIQLARRGETGMILGVPALGMILNTTAVDGFRPEAHVHVAYEERHVDGDAPALRAPVYTVELADGSRLPAGTVLMPRTAPPVGGVGLLEMVPDSVILALADPDDRDGDGVSGRVAWVEDPAGKVVGRFGWQATEPTVARQTAVAMAREMGLTSSLVDHDDCARERPDCRAAPNGGDPEVAPELFAAVVRFQQLRAVPTRVDPGAEQDGEGERLFRSAACVSCHVETLPVSLPEGGGATIAAYTDLLLHDLGDGLADRDVDGRPVASEWRTAPLWGLGLEATSGRPLRFLHDGRARTVEEAILWHGGEASRAREAFIALSPDDRAVLLAWLNGL